MYCNLCDKTFNYHSSLYRHLREVHGDQTSASSWRFKCLEPDCIFFFARRTAFIEHLTVVHSMLFNEQILRFNNMEEFTNWKHNMEEETVSSYIIENATYFKCNRSRRVPRKRDPEKIYKRKLKSQGYFHIDTVCTSRIKIICEDNRVTVNFQATHYGHTADLTKISLPKHIKERIAYRLICGDPCKRITQSESDIVSEHSQRVDLLTSKDFINVTENNCGIETLEGKRHEDDKILKLSSDIKQLFVNLQSLELDQLNDDTVDNINIHLNILNSLINNLPKKILTQDSNVIVNDDDEKTKYLHHPTKSKKRSSESILKGLTQCEIREIKKMLKNIPSMVISNNPAEDHRYF